jgi:hypothetical protein
MIYYILEVSKIKPTQFRVSVVRSDYDYAVSASTDFTYIGIYKNSDELIGALEPYVRMEEGT